MSSTILFFPSSLPDETLPSRIARYHILSGNRTENETFRDIFGTAPFSLNIIPKRIDDIASRLPGDKDANMEELLASNTILPVYKPFLGLAESRDGVMASATCRIPRREVSNHRMAKFCLACVRADLIEQGHSYWHRAHHIPGITVCWRHGETLLQACPKCSHPFYRRNKLLPNLAAECVCGWNPLLSNLSLQGSKIEQDFAFFSKTLLERNLPAIKTEILASSYSRKNKELGYTAGKLQSKKKLLIGVKSHFGEELLARIDHAYGQGKYHQWIRMTAIGGMLDMPITRHLILAFHLFKTVDNFEERLAHEALIFQSAKRKPRSEQEKNISSVGKRKLHRQKVTIILKTRSSVTLDYLWANAYQATLWLVANDKVWLNDALINGMVPKAVISLKPHRRDEEYANSISNGVVDLFLIRPGQLRVNITNMRRLSPGWLPVCPTTRKQQFPLASNQLEVNLESYWHFQLRRVLLALSEMSKYKLPPNHTGRVLVSSISSTVWAAVISHFEWDVEKVIKTQINPDELLKRTGVTRQWEGPPGPRKVVGGRSYVPLKSRKLQDVLEN
ncbi:MULTISPECIES: TniQ family protein [Pseudomonas syringae group]|uniref:TniQ family protein n=1 Tax=Pseudomonas TaxID=286 RepID=UPI000CD2391D|nr:MULTISPECIES: TniQ family protein [Pseudomonas syringae group]MCF5032553.1 transposase [Pseudomonas syringae]MCF8976625.1 transposase [Pseudomonas syringae]MCJ8175123.1 TniQ family protein [Pseudomonas viridiflava]UQB20204.1 TniQ family protein [Pseudomonas syringae pv. syringae]